MITHDKLLNWHSCVFRCVSSICVLRQILRTQYFNMRSDLGLHTIVEVAAIVVYSTCLNHFRPAVLQASAAVCEPCNIETLCNNVHEMLCGPAARLFFGVIIPIGSSWAGYVQMRSSSLNAWTQSQRCTLDHLTCITHMCWGFITLITCQKQLQLNGRLCTFIVQ